MHWSTADPCSPTRTCCLESSDTANPALTWSVEMCISSARTPVASACCLIHSSRWVGTLTALQGQRNRLPQGLSDARLIHMPLSSVHALPLHHASRTPLPTPSPDRTHASLAHLAAPGSVSHAPSWLTAAQLMTMPKVVCKDGELSGAEDRQSQIALWAHVALQWFAMPSSPAIRPTGPLPCPGPAMDSRL